MFKKFFTVFGLVGSLFASNAFADGHATLKQVQDRGHLQCGVSQGLFGFSNPDDAGNWTGLDVDFCRAMAAAIFNDPQAVKFTPLHQNSVLQLYHQVKLMYLLEILLGQ